MAGGEGPHLLHRLWVKMCMLVCSVTGRVARSLPRQHTFGGNDQKEENCARDFRGHSAFPVGSFVLGLSCGEDGIVAQRCSPHGEMFSSWWLRKQRREYTKGLEPDLPFKRPLPVTCSLQLPLPLNCPFSQLMNLLMKTAPLRSSTDWV